MKFYTSVGPNPRVVKLFMAEKGISIPEVEIDLRGGENRRPPYSADVNPTGQTPALELDDGSFLTEITAICEYLEELHPAPVLVGSTPEERARTRMWTRRVDLKICEPMTQGFRYAEGLPLFESRMRCLPEAADGGARRRDPCHSGSLPGPFRDNRSRYDDGHDLRRRRPVA